MTDTYHVPVMVREVIAYLSPSRGGLYFDGTVGGGGHAVAILESSEGARLVGVDRDASALAESERRLSAYAGRYRLVQADYAAAAASLDEPLSGALLDLGISSHQVDETGRGFTFREGAPLDMRMGGASSAERSAADLLNEATESELAEIFREWGEERRSRRLAAEVVRRRGERPFETSDDLVAAMRRSLGRLSVQDKARIFQSLRIAVNREIEALETALPVLRDRLEAEGVFVVLSYHSVEDRTVKTSFREWSRSCVCPPELPVCRCRGRALGELLTRRAVVASAEEQASNPRSRSARLRAWRKAA